MAANSLPEPKMVAGLFMLMVSGFVAMWLIKRKTGSAGPGMKKSNI